MKTGFRTAVIHVDILDDFINGTLPVPFGIEVVEKANIITRDAKRKKKVVVFLADCHDRRNSTHFKKWPVHCPREETGQNFHPDLTVPDGAFVVFKGTGMDDDGYSGFDKNNVEIYIVSHKKLIRLPYTCLEQLLDDLDVSVTEIDGLATDYCDKATAIDSVRLGYETRLVADACRAINVNDKNDPRRLAPEIRDIMNYLASKHMLITDENIALEEMRRAGVIFTTTDEVLAQS